MADTREQINNFIDTRITDELNKQNTAGVVRSVLKYMTANLASPADDDIGGGVRWINQPEVGTPIVDNGVASVPISAGRGYFNGATVSFEAITQTGISLAAEGLQRLDVVIGVGSGVYEYRSGIESENPVTPDVPDGALVAATLLFSTEGVEDETPPSGVSVVDKVEQGNLNAVSSNAVFKAIGGSLKPYDATKPYSAGDTFTDGDILYKVVTGWAANAYSLLSQVPINSYKLAGNLNSFFTRNSTLTHLQATAGFSHNVQHQGYVLNPDAPAGQVVTFTIAGNRIPQGRSYTFYIQYNGISTIQVDSNSRMTGDMAWPSGIVTGDTVIYEFLAYEEGVLTLVRKFIQGKESSGGVGVAPEASTREPFTPVLQFTNPAGHENLEHTQTAAIPFTLGAGPHKTFSVRRMVINSDGVSPITFSADFQPDFQYLAFNEDDTLPAGRYEFLFSKTADGVSVSVPGSGGEGIAPFTAISENEAGISHPAFSSQHDLNLYLLSNGSYTPPVNVQVSNISATPTAATTINITYTTPQ